MIIYRKKHNKKEIIISTNKYSDGNNYYIDKFVERDGFTFHTGMIINKSPILNLKTAKQIAKDWLLSY